MQADTQPIPVSKWMFWAGWIISILPVLALLMSGVMKLVQPEGMEKGARDIGWDMKLVFGLGIVEISCAIIYLIPRTAVLGAILLTGYLGGAVATHVRIDDPFYKNIFAPILLGVLVWGGLWLRDARLRVLVPWRS